VTLIEMKMNEDEKDEDYNDFYEKTLSASDRSCLDYGLLLQ